MERIITGQRANWWARWANSRHAHGVGEWAISPRRVQMQRDEASLQDRLQHIVADLVSGARGASFQVTDLLEAFAHQREGGDFGDPPTQDFVNFSIGEQ